MRQQTEGMKQERRSSALWGTGTPHRQEAKGILRRAADPGPREQSPQEKSQTDRTVEVYMTVGVKFILTVYMTVYSQSQVASNRWEQREP